MEFRWDHIADLPPEQRAAAMKAALAQYQPVPIAQPVAAPTPANPAQVTPAAPPSPLMVYATPWCHAAGHAKVEFPKVCEKCEKARKK